MNNKTEYRDFVMQTTNLIENHYLENNLDEIFIIIKDSEGQYHLTHDVIRGIYE